MIQMSSAVQEHHTMLRRLQGSAEVKLGTKQFAIRPTVKGQGGEQDKMKRT